jgi:hypothetical protein
MILLIHKWKKFVVEIKSHLQIIACIRERNFIICLVAYILFQLSSRLPLLLSPFPEATKFFSFFLHFTCGDILLSATILLGWLRNFSFLLAVLKPASRQ